jgi:hypothetical protein
MEIDGQKKIITGVSPAFAMTKMDDEVYPEADAYTEDENSATMLGEIIARSNQPDLILRYQPIPYGTANVGRALGLMAKDRRFPRPSIVLLDGAQDLSDGCLLLPGGDAPERVVFEGLAAGGMEGVAHRISRSPGAVADACNKAMLLSDHHDWIGYATSQLSVSNKALWQGMCAEWCLTCLAENERNKIADAILDTIVQHGGSRHITDRTQFMVQQRLLDG